MALPMEFWGVEVKAGQPLKVNPGNAKILHLSQASLGEFKSSKGNESVPLHVKFGDQKLVLGTLSTENFPQLSFDLVFEKEFELSHNWKSGSVYFCGYKSVVHDDTDDEFSDLEDDSEEEDLPIIGVENGKVVAQASAKAAPASANAGKAEPSGKQKASIPQPMKVDEDDDDEDEDDDEDDDDEDESDEEGGDSEADSDEEEDDIDKEETPKKAESGKKKRAADSATKTPVPAKKSKLPTPQKTDGKKGGHTATPHPAKQAGKNPANSANKSQTPKSASQVSCKSCSKTFNSEVALQSHSKAKHGGK